MDKHRLKFRPILHLVSDSNHCWQKMIVIFNFLKNV